MRNLLRIEAFKLRKGLTVKVLALVSVGYAVLIIGLFQMLELLFDSTEAGIPDGVSGVIPTLRLTGLNVLQSADLYSLIQIFMLVLLASLFSSEYARSTLKIMLVGGTDRVRLYLSKFVILALALLGYSLAGVVLITFFATLLNGWGGTFEGVQLLHIGGVALRITLLNLVYGALLAGVAILTKSTGIVIAIGIGLQFAEGLVTTVMQLVDSPVIDFLTRLIPSGYVIPFSALTVKPSLLVQGTVVSLVLITVFLGIGVRLFRRQDISA